jgi:hypothetical protein
MVELMLTKSLFTTAENCPKALWMTIHMPEEKAPPSSATQARMESGKRIGNLAQELFPGGVLVPTWELSNEDAAQRTHEILTTEVPAIFEATFLRDNMLVRVDIFALDGVIGPLMAKYVLNALESRTIATLRDTLVPKLISGKIRIADAERAVAEVI